MDQEIIDQLKIILEGIQNLIAKFEGQQPDPDVEEDQPEEEVVNEIDEEEEVVGEPPTEGEEGLTWQGSRRPGTVKPRKIDKLDVRPMLTIGN